MCNSGVNATLDYVSKAISAFPSEFLKLANNGCHTENFRIKIAKYFCRSIHK